MFTIENNNYKKLLSISVRGIGIPPPSPVDVVGDWGG